MCDVHSPHTHMCAYMLSEAGAVACCGWLAACVYKKLSSSNYAIVSESKLGGSIVVAVVAANF